MAHSVAFAQNCITAFTGWTVSQEIADSSASVLIRLLLRELPRLF